jgi:dihydropteroate synthase
MLTIANRTFTWGARTYIMAILNITPDSFSGDGLLHPADTVAAAVAAAQHAVDAGADILDVGGESTRPGAQPVSVAEELQRVVPVVAALAHSFELPISIDSYHPETVQAALDAGAHLVNDIWGLRTPDGAWNEAQAKIIAQRGAPLALMHNRRAQAAIGAIGGYFPDVAYADLVAEVCNGLQESVAYAVNQGIPRERLLIDPGLGFGKTPEQNMVLLRRLTELRSLGLPILLGASRKSFIGQTLGLPPQERDEGTAAVTAFAIQQGIDIVRVHNVPLNARVARMTDALVRG